MGIAFLMAAPTRLAACTIGAKPPLSHYSGIHPLDKLFLSVHVPVLFFVMNRKDHGLGIGLGLGITVTVHLIIALTPPCMTRSRPFELLKCANPIA
jgi:hypothetical protein